VDRGRGRRDDDGGAFIAPRRNVRSQDKEMNNDKALSGRQSN